MAKKILPEGYEQRIRDKLGVDDAYLPDSVLNQKDCVDIAEANIISQVPDYETLSGDKELYLEAATVCECAIVVIGTMRARLPENTRGPHIEYTVKADWDKRRRELITERIDYISKTVSYPKVRHFGKA